jgi:hypothetical protein
LSAGVYVKGRLNGKRQREPTEHQQWPDARNDGFASVVIARGESAEAVQNKENVWRINWNG